MLLLTSIFPETDVNLAMLNVYFLVVTVESVGLR